MSCLGRGDIDRGGGGEGGSANEVRAAGGRGMGDNMVK